MRVIARVANVRHHPHLVSLHEHYEDDFLIYIVMDSLKGGDLYDHLVDDDSIDGMHGGNGGYINESNANNGSKRKKGEDGDSDEDDIEIKSVASYTEYNIMLIATQILNAVNALHEVGVIHRDIKPENILYTDNNNNGKRDVLKIADFSLAGKDFHQKMQKKEMQKNNMKKNIYDDNNFAPILTQAGDTRITRLL